MGAYLSEPVTEKNSTDEENDRLRYGVSSMQGWRISQEDAHNCVIDFDKSASLFAVYDGHGGHEVAAYCSQKLPEFIKETEAYKKEDFEKALIDAFLGFDATISTREVVGVLKEIAGVKDNDEGPDGSDIDEENVNNLYEEASMPIEQVMEKYQFNLLHPHLKKMQGEKLPISPLLKARKTCSGESSGCSSSSSGVSSEKCETIGESSSSKTSECSVNTDVSSSSSSSSTTTNNGETKIKDVEDKCEEITSTGTEPKNETDIKLEKEEKKESITTNGDIDEKDTNSTQLNGEGSSGSSIKGKGKAVMKKPPIPETTTTVMNLRKRFVGKLYTKLSATNLEESDSDVEMNLRKRFGFCKSHTKLLEAQSDESDSDDDNDANFEGVASYSSSDSEGAGDENEDDSPEDEEEENEEDEEEDLYDEEDETNEFARNMTEEPGSDSGCTAVLALLRENTVYVANAGDSRCIICRKGEALDMSFDHKPEDVAEMDRIINAGGKVTPDGRVNGGLNLSRAIGDHAYKQNKDLSDREQMIIALPDIKTCTINPVDDEFMVLACDGIWNFMSSQEVIDFVKPRLNRETGPEKLSQICEELFDHCLAPHTMGDGTGCDNMTAIIVQFKNESLKRSSDDTDDICAKRAKTEEEPTEKNN